MSFSESIYEQQPLKFHFFNDKFSEQLSKPVEEKRWCFWSHCLDLEKSFSYFIVVNFQGLKKNSAYDKSYKIT